MRQQVKLSGERCKDSTISSHIHDKHDSKWAQPVSVEKQPACPNLLNIWTQHVQVGNRWDQVQAGLVLHKLLVYSSPPHQLSISSGPFCAPVSLGTAWWWQSSLFHCCSHMQSARVRCSLCLEHGAVHGTELRAGLDMQQSGSFSLLLIQSWSLLCKLSSKLNNWCTKSCSCAFTFHPCVFWQMDCIDMF